MNNRDIEWRKRKLEEKRLELESGQLNAVRGVFRAPGI